MAHTKKVGSAGRFGARYGRRIRTKVTAIEKEQKANHKCPSCSKLKVKRTAKGIYTCRSCNYVFAGKAYTPGA